MTSAYAGCEVNPTHIHLTRSEILLRPEAAHLQEFIPAAGAQLAGTKLTVSGSFEGLKTAATVARLHMGVMAGVRGPALQDLTISKAMSGTISGTADLTPPQLETLRKGGLYVQIHSEKAPEGVLWGWLLK